MSKWTYKPPIILSYEEFKEMYDIPDAGFSKPDNWENLTQEQKVEQTRTALEEQTKLYTKWLVSAHTQLDSLTNGNLFNDFKKMEDENYVPTDEEQKEIYIVKSCIGDTLEYFILTSRTFADLDKDIQASTPFSLKTKAIDGNLEKMRNDILIKFSNTRWYTLSSGINLRQNETKIINGNNVDNDFTTLVRELGAYFLRRNGTNQMIGNLQFENSGINTGIKIEGSGDIISGAFGTNNPKPSIKGYNIEDFVPDKTNKTDKILDPTTNMYKFINQFGVDYFGGMSEAAINEAIQQAFRNEGKQWSPDLTYEIGQKEWVFKQLLNNSFEINYYISTKNDNKGNEPSISPDWWVKVPDEDLPLGELVEQLKPYIDNLIANMFDELSISNEFQITDNTLSLSQTTKDTLSQVSTNTNAIENNTNAINLKTDKSYVDGELSKKASVESINSINSKRIKVKQIYSSGIGGTTTLIEANTGSFNFNQYVDNDSKFLIVAEMLPYNNVENWRTRVVIPYSNANDMDFYQTTLGRLWNRDNATFGNEFLIRTNDNSIRCMSASRDSRIVGIKIMKEVWE